MERGTAREDVEYVGGPLDGTSGVLASLPDELPALGGGSYVRSVRCADDGAMRYVWRPADPPHLDAGATKGDSTWPTGS